MSKNQKDTTGFLFDDPPDESDPKESSNVVDKATDAVWQQVFEPQENSSGMRDTSKAVFNQIKEDGTLSKMRWMVYEYLFLHGPLTGAELDEQLRKQGGRGHYHKRLSELKRFDIVQETNKRACKITGRLVYEWDVTSRMPKEQEDPVQKQQAVDFHVNNDHVNDSITITTDDKTATICIFYRDGQTHICIDQAAADGSDQTKTDLVLGVEGYTQIC